MKTTHVLFAILLLNTTLLFGADFLATYPMAGSECSGSVAVLKNGKIALSAVDFTNGAEDILVLVTDAAGSPSLARRIGTTGPDQAQDIVATRDGGMLIAGFTHTATRGDDGLLVKLNAAGGIVWKRAFGSAVDDYFAHIAPAQDGSWFVLGYTEGMTTSIDLMVARFTAAGNATWSRTLSTPGFDHASGIAPTPDGGIVIIDAMDTPSGYRTLIAKLSGSGQIQWTRQYGNSGNHLGVAIAALPDGTLAFLELFNPGTGASRTVLSRLNAQGIPQWSRVYGLEAFALSPTPDGGFLFTGRPSGSNARGAVLKVDQAGKLLWRKAVKPDERSVALGNVVWKNSDFLISGCVGDRAAASMDIFLMGLSGDGAFDGGCSKLTTLPVASAAFSLSSSAATVSTPSTSYQASTPLLNSQSLQVQQSSVCTAR